MSKAVGEKRTVKVWFNVYAAKKNAEGENVAEFIGFRKKRETLDGSDRIACIEREITFEVGEGL